ncbi:MAG: T9SS type A sorting domain-containing protein [Bacteroidota bacterium]
MLHKHTLQYCLSIARYLLACCCLGLASTASYAQCSMSCIGDIQLSLNQDCEAEVTYRMILRDPDNSDVCTPNGPSAYKVVVMDEEGVEIPSSPMVTCEYIGRTLQVKVKHWYSGNSCWSTMLVEDKQPPILNDCQPVTIFCTESAAPTNEGGQAPVPTMTNTCEASCQSTSLTYEDKDSVTYTCGDAEFEMGIVASFNRVWTACDDLGNCFSCTQPILIQLPTLADLDLPPSLTGDKALACGDCDPSDLSCTGSPVLNGTDLASDLCQIQLNYTDSIANVQCEGTYTILRNWTIQNTCTEETQSYTQTIEIVDRTPPTISCASGNIAVDASPEMANACMAMVTVPAADITDNCSRVENILVITKLFQLDSAGNRKLMHQAVNENGGFSLELAYGLYEVYYQATDDCGNVTNNLDAPCELEVKDDRAPTPVCNAVTKITLDRDGKGIIYAASFDNGSFDNCCLGELDVRRLDQPVADYTPFVEFTCADSDSMEVELRVSDCNGNSAICTVIVVIDDDVAPKIVSCAEPVSVNCADVRSLEELADALLTPPTTTDDCGGGIQANAVVKHDFRNECGIGAVVFEWQVFDAAGNGPATCEQLLAFVDETPATITFPEDYTATSCVNAAELTPSVTGMPTIEGNECELFETLFTDSPLEGKSTCGSFVRTWVVTNICAGDDATVEHQQTITFDDTEAPIVDCLGEFFDICLDDGACSRSFEVPGILALDCSETVDIRAEWTYVPNEICGSDTIRGMVADAAEGFMTPEFGPGQLWINFYATDECGNEARCDRDYTIKDCEAPEIICLPGITLNLNEMGIVEIWANDFHSEVLDNCEDCFSEDDYIFSFQKDTIDNVRFFDCSDLGVKTAQIWVTDAYGNQNFCPVTFVVKGAGECLNLGMDTLSTEAPDSMSTVRGEIFKEDGDLVKDVNIMVADHMEEMIGQQMTDLNGTYEFALARSSNVMIEPSKNDDLLNGVTTYDILQLRKHILGFAEIRSPYRLIAADVNHSNSVTTADIVALRRAILQVDDSFQNNTSWRFIDADYQFENPSNPFAEAMPETATIDELKEERKIDFVAIKVGDLNGSASGRFREEVAAEARSATTIPFLVSAPALKENTIKTVNFTLDNSKIAALQMTLQFDPNAVEILDIPTNGQITTTNFNTLFLKRGLLAMSWDAPTNTTEPLQFQLRVKTNRPMAVGELFTMSSQITPAVAYDEAGSVYALGLQISEPTYDYVLHQNHPNPFQRATTIRFTLPANSQGKLTIKDLTGRTLQTIERTFVKGLNDLVINEVNQKGILYYQLETDFGTLTQKMLRVD